MGNTIRALRPLWLSLTRAAASTGEITVAASWQVGQHGTASAANNADRYGSTSVSVASVERLDFTGRVDPRPLLPPRVPSYRRRTRQPFQELAGIRAEAFDKAALAFGIQCVKRQRRLARAAGAAQRDQCACRKLQVDRLKVVSLGSPQEIGSIDDIVAFLASWALDTWVRPALLLR